MSDLSEVLRGAREKVVSEWGSGNPDVAAGWCGPFCASIAISTVVAETGAGTEVQDAAHRAFLIAAGIEPATDIDQMYPQVYAFNDAQESAHPVLAAFDRAIETVDEMHEPTPHADSMCDVMAACDDCAGVVARYIVSEFPGMDLVETQTFVSAELFYAAQDATRVYELAANAEDDR